MSNEKLEKNEAEEEEEDNNMHAQSKQYVNSTTLHKHAAFLGRFFPR